MKNIYLNKYLDESKRWPPERFWNKLSPPDKNGCRIFTGHKLKNENPSELGYGIVQWISEDGAKVQLTHKVAWKLANGRSVPKGKQVCHTCDVRPCCEPTHLFLGTQKDNMQDASRKGRTWFQRNPELARLGGQKAHKNNTGKHLSTEHREKLSLAHTGKILSIEHRKKLSEAHKGVPLSLKHRASMSKTKKRKPWSDKRREADERRKSRKRGSKVKEIA